MSNAHLEAEGPFGLPDAAYADVQPDGRSYVRLPARFRGVARDPRDSRVRVVAGPLGAGKTLFLKRLRKVQDDDNSTFATNVQRNEDLSTRLVALFSVRVQEKGSNTEEWSLLWRRAIFCAAWSFIRNVEELQPSPKAPQDLNRRAIFQELRSMTDLLGSPATVRRVSSRAAWIIGETNNAMELDSYLHDDRWEDVENFMSELMRNAPPMYLYVDDLDRNYAWAPALWTQCQRGLFYAVMNLARDDNVRARLHTVISMRDVTLATVAAGEHAPRYLEDVHINHLRWNRESIQHFLDAKVEGLPVRSKASSGNTVEAWLGISSIARTRQNIASEGVSSYLVRHTRMVPRDIVILGNELCDRAMQRERPLTEDEIKNTVSDTSRALIRSELAVCANQMIGAAIPTEAYADDYDLPPRVDDEDIRDKVERLVSLIQATDGEVFLKEDLERLDAGATRYFGGDLRLSNLLWQHRLLSWLDHEDEQHFFKPEDYFGRHLLPLGAEVKAYQWHCMMFDIAELPINGVIPAYPQ